MIITSNSTAHIPARLLRNCWVRIMACGFLVAVFALSGNTTTGFSGEKPRFGGGMALQAGYVTLRNRFGAPHGVMTGLGGRLHFYTGNYFRIGGGGAAVKLEYSPPGLDGSYVRIGYGGVTAEMTLRLEDWRISAGILAGGAAYTNLHLLQTSSGNQYEAVFEQRGSFLVSPMVTLERSFTEAISLMVMTDYLWGPDFGDRHHLGGPKLHFGILFNK